MNMSNKGHLFQNVNTDVVSFNPFLCSLSSCPSMPLVWRFYKEWTKSILTFLCSFLCNRSSRTALVIGMDEASFLTFLYIMFLALP